MSQLNLDNIEKVIKLKRVSFRYSITMPNRYFSSCDCFIFNVNGLSKDEIAEKCETDMRKKMNNLFDSDDCIWSVKVSRVSKI